MSCRIAAEVTKHIDVDAEIKKVEKVLEDVNLLVYKVKDFVLKNKTDNAKVMHDTIEEIMKELEAEAPGCQGGIVVIPREDFLGGSVVVYVDEKEFNSKRK